MFCFMSNSGGGKILFEQTDEAVSAASFGFLYSLKYKCVQTSLDYGIVEMWSVV